MTRAANGISLATNIPDFCVGQLVEFHLAGLPAGATATNFQWTLDGIFVNDHTNAVPGGSLPASSENYFENAGLLTNAVLTNCWWVSGGNPPAAYNATVTCDLIFTNGKPPLGISAAGQFSMLRPVVNWIGFMPGTVEVDENWEVSIGNPSLHFGTIISTPLYTQLGMTLTKNIVNGGLYADASYYYPIQLFSSYSSEYCGTNGLTVHLTGTGLDGNVNALASYTANNKQIYFDDPGMVCDGGNHHVSYSASYQSYLMFNPQTAGSIGVPLRRIDWGWAGAAESVGIGSWQKASTNVPAITTDNMDTLNFPVWTNRLVLSPPMRGVTIYTNTTCD